MIHFPPTLVRPGDVLVYARRSFFNWLISVKTWSPYTHIEVVSRVDYRGVPQVVAARNGVGCDVYGFDPEGLALVLRTTTRLNAIRANEWWDDNACGQKYDWLGLFNFVHARKVGKNNGRMFCSEAATRYLRNGGVDPFGGADADTIAPSDFVKNSALRVIWRAA